MAGSLKQSSEPALARGEDAFSHRDRSDAGFLIAGFFLLVVSLLGAYLQHPSNDPKSSRFSWLVEPRERNVFLKFPSLGASLRGVHFDASGRGWAVGDDGTIVHTADGGRSWEPQTNTDKNTLLSIFGTGDGKALWAVGVRGAILHTVDGGQSWKPQTNPDKMNLRSLYGPGDGKTLWAVGDHGGILHTVDGGQSWQEQTKGDGANLLSIFGAGDERALWAVGAGGAIVHTADGGQTWQTQNNADKNTLWSIYGSSDGKSLWAVGDGGAILHTTDGGQSWQAQANADKNSLRSIYGSRDGKLLWAVGGNGVIVHTADGGQSWQAQTYPNENTLLSISGSGDNKKLWAVGSSGAILHTEDGGESWHGQTNVENHNLRSVSGSSDGKTLWAVGDHGTILQSTDGGKFWQAQTNADQNALFSIYGIGDGETLWAVGDHGAVLHTVDGGQSWQVQSNADKSTLWSIYGTGDGKMLWAVSDDGAIQHSTDGGQSWQKQINTDKNILHSISGTGDGKALWAVGSNGAILHTTDGGLSWQPQTNADRNTLLSVYGNVDGKALWAVGTNGVILHTVDGGQSWQPQTNADKNTLWSIYGIGDGKTLWAAGFNGTILRTTNGGQSWQSQINTDQNALWSIYGTGDGKTLWAVGFNGAILHTTDGGASWTSLRKSHPYDYRPALWVWLMLAGAIGLIVTGSVRLARPVPAPKPSIENAGLSDQAATKLDQDLLDVADTVRGMAEFLRNRNTEPPVTISVEGQWGLGKTSVMRMLESELRRARVPTVWFNAWHNEGEEQMLAFLLEAIRQTAFPKWWNLRELPFRLRLLVIRFARWPVILFLTAAAALFIVHPAIDWVSHNITPDVSNLEIIVQRLRDLNWAHLIAIATGIGAAYPLVRRVLMLATGISAQPSDLLSDSESKSSNADRASFRTRFAGQFCEAVEALGPDRRLTIFIDDLDRCQPEQVRQTLEAVNFLISSAKCFVVMGIVRNVVEASVGLGFKEIAEELEDEDTHASSAVITKESKEQAARRRRRTFAHDYLLKLINLTVILRPYSGDSLAKVATASVRAEGPSWIRQATPYALIAVTILATVLLWNVHKIPRIDEERKILPEESYQLPGSLNKSQLKSLLVERDADGNVVGEKRTYDVDEKAPDQTGNDQTAAGPGTSATEGADGSVGPASSLTTPPQGSDFEPGQTYSPSRWLWWMAPLLAAAVAFTIRAFFFRRQRPIRDSSKFRDALRLWRTVYENEIRTPREIKRFINELRYKAIRFRGPQPTVPVGKSAVERPDDASDKEPSLILIAILERLNRGNWEKDPLDAAAWLPEPLRATFAEHIQRFGKPSAADFARYRALFGHE